MTTVCAWFIWRRSPPAIFIGALVGGLADVGYFLFLDLGGYVNFVPGTVMTLVSSSAIILSFGAYFSGKSAREQSGLNSGAHGAERRTSPLPDILVGQFHPELRVDRHLVRSRAGLALEPRELRLQVASLSAYLGSSMRLRFSSGWPKSTEDASLSEATNQSLLHVRC